VSSSWNYLNIGKVCGPRVFMLSNNCIQLHNEVQEK
jgi:hypothetical protein